MLCKLSTDPISLLAMEKGGVFLKYKQALRYLKAVNT